MQAVFRLPETEFAVQGDAGSVVAQGLPVHGACAQFAEGALQQQGAEDAAVAARAIGGEIEAPFVFGWGDAFQAAVALGRAAECVNVHFEAGVGELGGEPCLVLGPGDRVGLEHHGADAGVVAPCVDARAVGGGGGA